jgi:hypothetical protein
VTDTDIQSKLVEYEGIIRMLTAKVEELVADNQRLTSELTAHQTLKAIYADPNQPATVRVRAAQAALNVETPRLEPQPAPLNLVAEEIEPLAVVVERQRARMNALQGRNIEVLPSGQVLLLDERNGSDD